ncbi:MAG TPA: TetR/AcrR family transcriptional regulator [Thermoleophilaceae bacterium]|nr:TetR/AcrR family transcriptional regulator [Thermoleophilaceae bacterium]
MTETSTRRPGRPRSEEAEQAILDAVLELLPEHGLKGLSIEAVAAQAGVGKTTIYRRWATKPELVVAALSRLRPPAAPPDTGSLAGDLGGLVAIQQERLAPTALPRLVPRVLADSIDDPELHAEMVKQVVGPLRAILRELIGRAIERGEVREDVDVEALVDVLHGAPVYKLLMSGGDMSVLIDIPTRIVPLLLQGASSSSAGRASARRRS